MTPQEYRTRLDALKKKELELAEEFIKNNPFKELEGKLVNLRIGCSHQKVLFVGADFTKGDIFGEHKEPAYFYHKLKKDGTPWKKADFIQIRFYDGKIYKIEKL